MKPARRNTTSVVLAFCLLGAATASAQSTRGVLDVRFAVTSTLHDFEGTVGALKVSLAQDASGTWSADVTLPVAQLKTGIDKRDESMREMFDAAAHPQIRGRFRGVDPERVRSSGKLPFVLAIKNVERPVEARVTHWQQSESTASFDADFTVSLAAFQLEAPQILFISVGDAVHVSVHLKLERT
jgi:polyisoprenoid-binding protein YceI